MRAELRLFAVTGVTALALLAAGCGGSEQPFKIGVVVDCEGVFSALTDQVLAGAELPLLERGGRLAGRQASAGIDGPRVGGRRVEIRQGCAEIGYLTQLIENVRRLVEVDRVAVVIAPLVGNAEGLVLRELAHRYPRTVFIVGYSGAPETTLRDPAPNLFRFVPDAAQATAGLGTYAYRDLGWRTASVIFPDNGFAWPQAAGFVAEFCALGGSVRRLPAAEGASADAVARLAKRTDGVALLTQSFSDTVGYAAAYAGVKPALAGHLVLGPSAFGFADPSAFRKSGLLLRGVVLSGLSYDPHGIAWVRFRHAFQKRFPGLGSPVSPADFPIVLTYYDAVEASVRALEQAHAAGPSFLHALASMRLDSPAGPIRLDRNRQAVVSGYLSRVEVWAKGPSIRTFRVLPNVEQTFAGYFGPRTPTPTASRPGCHTATTPPWAK